MPVINEGARSAENSATQRKPTERPDFSVPPEIS